MHAADLRHYAEPAILRDGGSILVRAVTPEDKPLLLELFRRLSPTSVRHRVFGVKTQLSEKELTYLTELDFVKHVGLAAMLREHGEERMIGVGRYHRIHAAAAEAGAAAEVAFAVVDEHQGRGIGTVLLEHLARAARAQGIEQLHAEVMGDNAQMMHVFAESGFAVHSSLESAVYHVAFPTSATEAFVRASDARERHAAAESVRTFFEPASVAVIGASRREGSIGSAIVANLKRTGFAGPIYPVNPAAAEVEGLPCFASIAATKAKIDLAVIAVPAAAVEEVVLECAHAGVRGVIVISSGFAEASAAGREAQNRLRRVVRTSGMRMVGPNCMGLLNAAPAVRLNATFAPTWPPAGNVSMLSQSGALGIAMLDHAAHRDIGIAKFISVGNKADVSGNDLLSYWADDPETDVIALYLESFGNPRKFARIAPEVARKKPIVAVKSGRSAAGTRAAASHSASLASLDVGVDALFAQAGVIRTNTLEELFDVVALLSSQPLPQGPRVGVVTNAGGPGILLADACEAHGLSLPELAPETVERLRGFLPAQAGYGNPIDMIASATPEQFARAIEAVGTDSNVDALVVIYIPPMVTRPEEIAAAIARGAATVPLHKPIATVFMSSKGTPASLSGGARGKIPSYTFPENAALALAAATRYASWRKRPPGNVVALEREAVVGIRNIIDRLSADARSPSWIPAEDVGRVLALAGVRMAEQRTTTPEPDEAARVATSIGYPVVAKAVARGLVHKSDIGGVILDLGSEDDVRAAVRTLAERAAAAGHELEGVLLQRQIDGGIEAIVGVTTDPSMGPILVAGFGGVQVELLRDVAFRLTPVSDSEAAEMLEGLRAAKLLDGFRGAPPADRAALLATITRVSALVEVVPELLELELNPLKVLARGEGAIAVDARMRIGPA
jgi:acetyl coenzyme A synthetase (ADP forming)-like protein